MLTTTFGLGYALELLLVEELRMDRVGQKQREEEQKSHVQG